MSERKIYAYEMDAETNWDVWGTYVQDCEAFNDTIIVTNDYHRVTASDVYGKKSDLYENALNALTEDWTYSYDNISEFLNDIAAREDGKRYSSKQVSEWKKLIEEYDNDKRNYYEDDHIARAMTLISGKEYTSKAIRGCCQGDYAVVFYPENEYTDNNIEYLEACYFGTGSEWKITEGEDDDGYCDYFSEWREEDIRKRIAKESRVDPEDVIMFKFDHYQKTPVYKELAF